MFPILLWLLFVWLLWSPVVLLWAFSRRSSTVKKYANLIVAVYVTVVLLVHLFYTSHLLSPGLW